MQPQFDAKLPGLSPMEQACFDRAKARYRQIMSTAPTRDAAASMSDDEIIASVGRIVAEGIEAQFLATFLEGEVAAAMAWAHTALPSLQPGDTREVDGKFWVGRRTDGHVVFGLSRYDRDRMMIEPFDSIVYAAPGNASFSAN